ncbi:MAG TPA: SdrD B-like domain-containing protein [Chloroflexota bacterium]|nr:SdrD B-like domain-containing protein [Chloroflexota bacterium]
MRSGRNRVHRGRGTASQLWSALLLALVVAMLLPSSATGQTATPTSTATPTPRFVTGTVFDDTKNRNGIFDDNESGVDGTQNTVTVSLERVDVTGLPIQTTVIDGNGRYRFDPVPPGTYLVSVDFSDRFETTTPRQRQVIVTAADGAVVNFGLARANIDRRFVVGIVFEDKNMNGIKDGDEKGTNRSGINITLDRVDGTESPDCSGPDGGGKYKCENLTPGTYVLTLKLPSDAIATTSTRREITITRNFDDVEDFGVFFKSSATATAAASATSVAGATATAVARLGGFTSPAQATAVARIAALATQAAQAAQATAGVVAAPAAIPPALRRLAIVDTARFVMKGVAFTGGQDRIDMLAEGVLIFPDQLSMRLLKNDFVQDFIIVKPPNSISTLQRFLAGPSPVGTPVATAPGRVPDVDVYPRAFTRSARTDNVWQEMTYFDVWRELGVLTPLQALVAFRPQFIRRAAEGGEVVVNGEVATYYTADIDTVSLWDVFRAAGGRDQPVAQQMQMETWVGKNDRLIRSQRFTALMLNQVSDPLTTPDPFELNISLTLSEVNRPLTIIAPSLPTPVPAPGTPAPGAPGAPPGAPRAAPAPPVIEGTPPPGAEETPTPEVPPEGVPPQPEQVLAAERALVALVTGGQPRTNSFARGNSILLDVPFRTQQDGTPYAETNSAPAGLAMVLGGYGIDVALTDLRALFNGLESNYTPSNRPRVETLARIAERGGLNVIDLFRGARFNEWTIEMVREMLRRGYPVVTLAQGAVLPGGTPPNAARERFITIIGMDGDDFIYHDPAYPDEGTGAARRINARTLEQAWLAASTPRLAAGFSLGPEGRGMLDFGRRVELTPGRTPTPPPEGTITIIGTIAPTATPGAPETPFGLPVHPLLIFFWAVLVILLLAILIRSLR